MLVLLLTNKFTKYELEKCLYLNEYGMYFLFLGDGCYEVDTNYLYDHFLQIGNVKSRNDCKLWCDKESKCFLFTYVDDPKDPEYKYCYLKDARAKNSRDPNPHVVSGKKSCFESGESYCNHYDHFNEIHQPL